MGGSELSLFLTGRTISSPSMVRTVRRTILRFLTDLLIRCRLRPELRCAGCTQTRVHVLTNDTCRLSSIHSWPKASTMDATAVGWLVVWFNARLSRARLSISLYLLGPTDNADPPTSPQMRPFPPKREVENIHAFSHVLQSQFFCFFFHGRAFRFQPIRRKVRRTRRTVPRACRAKRFGPRTQLRHSSSNCPN